jgi:hypothetical protein
MKNALFVFFALVGFTSTASATVESYDRVYLVIQNFNEGENDFFVERAPLIGCYGLPQGARLAQFTAPYKAPSNIGCGGKSTTEDINALVCAKTISSKESKDYASFSEITLDISRCPAKHNPKFITMLRTAAKLNFPQSNKKKEVKLILIK